MVLVLIVTLSLGLMAWKPPVLWIDTFGTPPNANSATVIAFDSSGVYVEGYVNRSGIAVPGGEGSLFLRKYDLSGGVAWMRTIGNANNTFFEGMSLGPDGIYLTGEDLRTGLVLKYDLSGNQVWLREFGNQSKAAVQGDAISATSTGVYVVGVSGVSFVREYDFAGSMVWTNEANALGIVESAYAASSGVYVAGRIGGSLPGQSQIGGYDAYLVKYDLAGNLVWARQFGTLEDDSAYSVSADSTGVYVSGNMMTASFGFLRKYDFNGNLDWASQIDSPDHSGLGDSSVSVDSSGIYVSVSTPANHEFILRYDLQGRQIWTLQMPPTREDAKGNAYRLGTGIAGVYAAGSIRAQGRYGWSAAWVGEVSSSPSLVFFGLNPPLSFAVLGILVTVAVISILFLRRRYLERMARRPQSASPDRYRKSGSA